MQAAVITLADGESSPTPDTDGPVSNTTPRIWNLGGGLTMTVRAFSLATDGLSFNNASTTQFGPGAGGGVYGLGVCASDDQCTFDEWQVDNNGRDNFVLFTFNMPVNIATVAIRQSTATHDSDTAWFASTTAAITPSLSWFNQNVVNGPTMNPDTTRNVAIGANGVQSLLFGAPSNRGDNDYFKIWSVDATASAPEPGSMMMLGSGLLGLGIVARRRRKKN